MLAGRVVARIEGACTDCVARDLLIATARAWNGSPPAAGTDPLRAALTSAIGVLYRIEAVEGGTSWTLTAAARQAAQTAQLLQVRLLERDGAEWWAPGSGQWSGGER